MSDYGYNKPVEHCCHKEEHKTRKCFEVSCEDSNCECKKLANEIQCKAKEIIGLAEKLKCTCDRPVEVKLDCEIKRPDKCTHRPDCKCCKCCK